MRLKLRIWSKNTAFLIRKAAVTGKVGVCQPLKTPVILREWVILFACILDSFRIRFCPPAGFLQMIV